MVGDTLRIEREKQGLTIADIEKGTSIRALYIQSIEENHYDVIPGEVYLKGFIKSYANFLKLDGPQLVQQYVREKSAPIQEMEEKAGGKVENMAVPAAEEKTSEQVPEPAAHKQEAMRQPNALSSGAKRGFSNKAIVGVAVLFVVVGGIYWGFGFSDDKPVPPAASVPAKQQPAPKAEPAKPAAPSTPASPVSVSLKFADRCWTEVKVDNKSVYEGIPDPGQVLAWSGQQNITVKLGNAGAVDVVYNGKEMGKLGDSGDVIEKSFVKNTTNEKVQ